MYVWSAFYIYYYLIITARKKIIMNAWAVTITLYKCESPPRNADPGEDNSSLIKTENAVPTIPENTPNRR